MSKIIAIKQRSDSIGKIKKIAQAMEVIALTRLKKSQKGTLDTRFYFDEIRRLVFDIAEKIDIKIHPFFAERKARSVGIIIISSDKGLCGGFNNNVIERTRKLCEEKRDLERSIIALGRKGHNYFVNRDYEIFDYVFSLAKDNVDEEISVVSDNIIRAFLQHKIDEVYLVFNYFKLQLLGEVRFFRLLPITFEKRGRAVRDYIYEPSAESVFDKLLNEYVKCQIAHAVKESKTAEEMARMVAMKQAGDSADELINTLLLKYHKERQGVITRELIDVISASEI